MTYYDIMEIECPERSIFQTLEELSKVLNVPYKEFLDALGFNSNREIIKLMLDPPTNYFSIERFLCPKINHILRTKNIPIRLVSKRKRTTWPEKN